MLTQIELANIEKVSEDAVSKFWRGVERLKQKDEQRRIQKIVGAATDEELLLLNIILSGSLITSSMAIATALAVSQVNEDQGNVFIFRTEGDDRVCPICEPLDGEIMKESEGTVVYPPFHDNCRCMLEPLV